MTGKTIGIIIAVLVIIGGAWYLLSGSSSTPPAATTNTPAATTNTPATAPTASAATIDYTDSGFVPNTISVPVGTVVTFVNQSGDEMWIASNPHPTHQGYDGTTQSVHCAAGYSGPAPFDECAAVMKGGSFSFTFTKAGVWGYHNHGAAANGGSITVTAAASASVNANL